MSERYPIGETASIAVSVLRHETRDPGYPQVKDPDVLGYLNAANAYFEAAMKPHRGLIDTLFAEMKGRVKDDDASVPQKDGAFVYWNAFDPVAWATRRRST